MGGKGCKLREQEGMVGGVHIAKQQIIGADVKCRTDPDDVFRAQSFFSEFRRGNGLRGDARFFSKFLLGHAELFPAAQYAAADLL